MNAERLKELAQYLVRADAEMGVQRGLEVLARATQNLGSNPGATETQEEFVNARREFDGRFFQMMSALSPAQQAAIADLKGARFFSGELHFEIHRVIEANTMTPHVAAAQLDQLRDARQSYLTNLDQLDDSLAAIGITAHNLDPGGVELGFLLPREIFHNRFDELVKELDRLNKIISAFAEAVLGTADEVELHQISTSDPTFSLGMNVSVAFEIAKTVAEFIGALKAVSEIAKALGIVKTLDLDEGVTKALDAGTKQIVDKQIAKRVEELVGDNKSEDGRTHEVRNSLERAMKDLFARVERGMTVEIRLLPPSPEQAAADPKAAEVAAKYEALEAIRPRLEFSKTLSDPLLKLTRSDNDDEAGS